MKRRWKRARIPTGSLSCMPCGRFAASYPCPALFPRWAKQTFHEALLALKLTHTPFSVSSVLGLLVLMGVSVETAVIDISYINKLRLQGEEIRKATFEASLVRLRPIMMTALVACLGLLPAALSTGIGSDTQRPFAIVIVAGLISRLFIGFFVNPVLYEAVAREGDVLQV